MWPQGVTKKRTVDCIDYVHVVHRAITSAPRTPPPLARFVFLRHKRAVLFSNAPPSLWRGLHVCIQGMLLREVQGEVLALQREQTTSAGGSSNGQNQQQQQHQPPTLLLTSPAGSGSSSPGSLLLLRPRTAASALPDEPVHGGSGTVLKGSGTVLEGSETPGGASKAPDAGFDPPLSSSLLLLGWEIANDGAGNEFYHNGSTGESRWDPPTPDAVVGASARLLKKGDGEQTLPEAGGYDGGGVGAADSAESSREDEALKQPVVLPVGWEAVAVDDGGFYYHHVASGVTQWEAPPGKQPASTTAAAIDASGHEGGGEEPMGDTSTAADGTAGWEEFQADEGVPFWYNADSGESCWELPGDRTE